MSDRVAIVTGASSGIGEASAEALAAAGFAVAVVARREDRLQALAALIEAAGGRALAIPADLADEAETAQVVRGTLDAFGRVDVLVNNAGFGVGGPLEHRTREDMRRQFEVNLLAGLQLAGLVAPVMRAQGGGRIVQMSSLIAHLGFPGASLYSASKGALERATDALRVELAPWGIRVVLVIPGAIDTPAFERGREETVHISGDASSPYRRFMERMEDLAEIQLKGAPGPETVGRVVVEAATAPKPRARYMTPASAAWTVRLLPFVPARWIDRGLRRFFDAPSKKRTEA